MGLDIHAFGEIQMPAGWAALNVVDGEAMEMGIARSDEAFALLGHRGRAETTGLVPIAAPRGVPGDVSEEVYAGIETHRADGADESWLSLGDLWASPLTKKVERTLWVRDEVGHHAGTAYADLVQQIANVSPEEAMHVVRTTGGSWTHQRPDEAEGWSEITLRQTRAALGGMELLERIVLPMAQMAYMSARTPDQVRIVFTFA